MNFMVQSLIQDLENMGHYASAVTAEEWREKWLTLSTLTAAESHFVREACSEGFRLKAWETVQRSDPNPAKTQRANAFEGLFKSK